MLSAPALCRCVRPEPLVCLYICHMIAAGALGLLVYYICGPLCHTELVLPSLHLPSESEPPHVIETGIPSLWTLLLSPFLRSPHPDGAARARPSKEKEGTCDTRPHTSYLILCAQVKPCDGGALAPHARASIRSLEKAIVRGRRSRNSCACGRMR
jgi:hypothetical protein